MAPITWHNIAAPNFRDSILANQAAGENFNAAGANLQRILAEQSKIANANWDTQGKLNENAMVAKIQGITDLGSLTQQQNDFDSGSFQNQFGMQGDPKVVAAALAVNKAKLLDAAKGKAVIAGTAAFDQDGSGAAAGEAARAEMLRLGATGTESNDVGNDFFTKGLAIKNAAQAEKVTANTQAFINSLVGTKIDPTNIAAITQAATEAYGKDIDMNAVLGHTDRISKGEDRVFDRGIKDKDIQLREQQLTATIAEHAANNEERNANSKFRGESLKQAADEKFQLNLEKFATEGNLPDSKLYEKARSNVDALDKDKNQGDWTGFVKPNDSEEEKNAAAVIEFDRLKAAQNISTEERRSAFNTRYSSNAANNTTVSSGGVANTFKPTKGSDMATGLVNHYTNSAGNASAPDDEFPKPITPDSLRVDGTMKGPGFLGKLANVNGKESTELSMGVKINGKETLIPALVPTLSKDEINWLLENNMPTPEIEAKAAAHAQKRIAEGKPVFATHKDTPEDSRLVRKTLDEISEARSGNAFRDAKKGLWSNAGVSDVKQGIQKAPAAIAAELAAGLDRNANTAKDVANLYTKFVGKPAEKVINSGMNSLKIQQAKDLAKQRLKNGVLTEEEYYKEILRLSGAK